MMALGATNLWIRDGGRMALDREALEDIYNRVPIWLQNGALSAYGLHTRLTRYNTAFFRQLDALRAREIFRSS